MTARDTLPAPDRPPRSATAAGTARDLEMFEAGQAARTGIGDCWVPVEMLWRHVQVHDVFLARDGALWTVRQVNHSDGGTWVDAGLGLVFHAADVDPDETVAVLVPVPERDAVTTIRDQMGAQLVARRTV